MTINLRRVVTGHDANGKAVIRIDDVGANAGVPGRYVAAAHLDDERLYQSISPKMAKIRARREIGTTIKNGSVFRVVRTEPGVAPRNHRTDSIDYAVVMSGEIDMEMDDTVVHLKAGDVLVQRGTIHNWVNNGTEPCVIAFVLISSDGNTAVGKLRPAMRYLLLQAQAWWDAQRFDQPGGT